MSDGKAIPILIPNLGTDEAVEVIEVLVSAGDTLSAEQAIIVLESDKASMEIPAPAAGKLQKITVKKGDMVQEGTQIGELIADVKSIEAKPVVDENTDKKPKQQDAEPAKKQETTSSGANLEAKEVLVNIPDLGTDEAVEIIEVHCKEGQDVKKDDVLIVLESDKASMEIPAPYTGKILKIQRKKGESVRSGDLLASMLAKAEIHEAAPQPQPAVTEASQGAPTAQSPSVQTPQVLPPAPVASGGKFYAGPAVRRLGREFGVDLSLVRGSGNKGRILKEDVQSYVRNALMGKSAPASALPHIPETDFAQFGKLERVEMTRIQKRTAENMRRAWLNIPHVTQFEEADITELEVWRKGQKKNAEKKNVKLTPVPLLIKALALGLKELPQFNVSISGSDIIHKKYCHVGMAVDTPGGLVVPVLRDVDKKTIWEIASEVSELAEAARNRRLKKEDMQGGCITLSSLGGLGGTQFTPIINPPEVAILGVSKAVYKPVYKEGKFAPRLILPLALSYDHRAVNGVDGAKFTGFLAQVLHTVQSLTD